MDIRALIEEKSECCVSIIIPTHRTSPDRHLDQGVLLKSVAKAKRLLIARMLPPNILEKINQSLDRIVLEFDPVYALDGIGIFVSTSSARLVHFPFFVKEKVVVDSTFEVRELYYLEQFSRPYYVLKLTREEAHLYQLENGKPAREITNTYFPMRKLNDYEYARPYLGTSYGYALKSVEKDKSIILKARIIPFYREVSVQLIPFTKSGDLLISGAKNILSLFESARDKKLRIKGKISGSFKELNELFHLARLTHHECKHNEIQLLIDRLSKLVGEKRAVYGLKATWTAVYAGKGDILLVEKEFMEVGLLLNDNQYLSLNRTHSYSSHEVDLVEKLIESVIAKGGRVVFTEQNQLNKFHHIALMIHN